MHTLRIAAAFLLATLVAGAQAQNYPTRPIRFIVPIAAGGGADLVARVIAERLSRNLGQQVVVENRAGGGTVIGAELVARSPADGYTWLLGTATSHAINASLVKKLPYDPVKDFAPITMLYLTDVLLGVHPSLPVKNVKEFIAYAKSKPGTLNYASAGTGSVAHLAGVMLINMTGITSTHIPYKGGAANILAVAGGEAQWLAAPIGSTIGQVRAGRIRGLAVGGTERSSFMPEMPTLNESGVPGYQFYTWNGLMAPTGTPRAIIERIHAAAIKALNLPDVREQYVAAGVELRSSASPEAFAKFIAQEQQKMRNLAAGGGITPE